MSFRDGILSEKLTEPQDKSLIPEGDHFILLVVNTFYVCSGKSYYNNSKQVGESHAAPPDWCTHQMSVTLLR